MVKATGQLALGIRAQHLSKSSDDTTWIFCSGMFGIQPAVPQFRAHLLEARDLCLQFSALALALANNMFVRDTTL